MTNRFSAFATSFAPNRMARLIITTALAAGVLTGCATGGIKPGNFAASSEAAMAKGRVANAVDNAEKAVLADPRNAAYRVLLGNAYLKAGRFESARQAYDESMELGEDSSQTALSLALADIALGRNPEAIDTLNSYRDSLDASDFGLALALAGQPAQGVAVLSDALRGGENTPKVRQNLALAYALGGQWREARTMAAQDVAADEVGNRMEQWAQMGHPALTRQRVAGLLSVPVRTDEGQPTALALVNYPATEQLAAEAATRAVAAPASAAAPALAEAAVRELPAIDQAAAPAPSLDDASSQPRQAQLALIDLPSSHRLTVRAKAPFAAPKTAARHAAVAVKGTHLVQLGSFSSAEGARRAWRHFTARNPSLAGYRNMTTRVAVNGKTFWRVQAAGFANQALASSMCGSVKARGGACMVMRGQGDAMPGQRAVDARMARR
ncbi:MAG: hypothetical protein RIS85_1550 [Pseudomonadota bacterium]